jgi:hypothetical protein
MNRRWLGLGAIGLTCCAFAACSSDDTNNAKSAATDAGTDSTTTVDAAVTHDASTVDGSVVDGSVADSAATDGAADGTTDAATAACAAFDASGLDEASVAAGLAQVFEVYKCYSCHQGASQTVSDAGAGIVLSGNNAGLGTTGTLFPPNLTSDPATGLGCWSDSEIENAILHGVDPEGGALCSPMPKYGSALTTADGGAKPGTPMDAGTAQEIVDFLRSLPVVVNQVPATTCAAPDAGSDAGVDAAADGSADASDQ